VKLAILGGSFNPIHIGHLHLADSALEAFHFDQLLLIPANISPFKVPVRQESQTAAASAKTSAQSKNAASAATEVASGADRLDMILASITGDSRIAVDDLELRRGGVSYTIDTLREIIDRYRPENKPALILGDDLVADFSLWKEAEEITKITDIIIARRRPDTAKSFPFPHTILDNEVLDISSAMVRERIAADKAGLSSTGWRYLVPGGARLIIEERGLYGATKAGKDTQSFALPALIARVEEAARETLSTKRFIHSRNTAFLARDIALRHGLDGDAAYLAGIAHDMAKTLEPGLFHGRAAAVLLEERFGIHNKDVLEAVEYHTTGVPGMGKLAKAVFIADKIEFSRRDVESQFREKALEKNVDLNQLFYAVLEDNVQWLKDSNIETSENTLRLLEEKQSSLKGNGESDEKGR